MNKFYTLEILKNFKRIIDLIQKFGYQQINKPTDSIDFVLIDRELINLLKDIDNLEDLIHQEIKQN
jgi:hypothetical protein|tara:strand:- start:223 stop:420 length:198 start_codon:yes stop_codon:yes gene_type:complete